MNATTFADTFYWISLTNPDDAFHKRCVIFDATSPRPQIVTTDEVLVEFLTFFSGQGLHLRTRAAAVVRQVFTNRSIHVMPQSRASFQAGFELYVARPDKRYSLTDCISMQTMRRQNLTDVLTNDHHFAQEGFQILFDDNEPARD